MQAQLAAGNQLLQQLRGQLLLFWLSSELSPEGQLHLRIAKAYLAAGGQLLKKLREWLLLPRAQQLKLPQGSSLQAPLLAGTVQSVLV